MTHPSGIDGSTPALGHWLPNGSAPTDSPDDFRAAIGDLRSPVVVVHTKSGFAVAKGGFVVLGPASDAEGKPVAAYLPPLPAERLGDPAFLQEHGVKFAYMTGAM